MNTLRAELRRAELRKWVMERGSDRRQVGYFLKEISHALISINAKDPIWSQVVLDIKSGYKFYDALAMWLDQPFSKPVLLRLEVLAMRYLAIY